MLYIGDWYNIVNQLYFNEKINKIKLEEKEGKGLKDEKGTAGLGVPGPLSSLITDLGDLAACLKPLILPQIWLRSSPRSNCS